MANDAAKRRHEQEERGEIPRRIPSKAGGPVEIPPSPAFGAKGSSVGRIRFMGKDHSRRPANSRKRLGRRRGKGGGGVQGAMRRLAQQVSEGRVAA